MDHNNILGAVLAGGKSQRFGEDKSQVKLNGKFLIDYILSEIIDEFKEILIVSNNQIKKGRPGVREAIQFLKTTLFLALVIKITELKRARIKAINQSLIINA